MKKKENWKVLNIKGLSEEERMKLIIKELKKEKIDLKNEA